MSVSGLPTLTRRVDLDETAWPPPLPAPHSNGVTRVTALHIYSQAPDTLGLAPEAIGAGRTEDDTYILGDGTSVVITDGPGPAAASPGSCSAGLTPHSFGYNSVPNSAPQNRKTRGDRLDVSRLLGPRNRVGDAPPSLV